MLSLDFSRSLPPLRQPWRAGITVGRAADLLRADLQDHLRWLQREIGYGYCRFHALFHDDMQVVLPHPDGGVRYNWHHIDKVYDFLLSIGLKPFVELNPMPAALASGAQTMFFYKMNVTPPRDYAAWGDLVEAFARHCVERYGAAEVRSWHFEVWNEPNLPGFWSGTKEDYWQLYAASAHAVKRVHPALRIGGPATSKANWIGEFIAHCHAHAVPLDFVSTHLYPQDEYVEFTDRAGSPHAPGEYFTNVARSVREVVRASPRPDLPIHWTEWNTQSTDSSAAITWGDNVYVDNRFAAGFIARHCTELDDACESLAWWVASDIFEEGGIPTKPFSCTYGLLNPQGIPKASANAFRLLAQLRGARVALGGATCPAHCGAVATREGDVLRVLLWNVKIPEVAAQPVWQSRVQLPAGLPAQLAVLSQRIGPAGGSPYEHWVELGRPDDLPPTLERFLRQKAEPVLARENVVDHTVPFHLGPDEVLLLEIRPAVTGGSATVRDAAWADWDQKMGARSR